MAATSSLAALQQKAAVTLDPHLPLRSYIQTAAKVKELADKADRSGDAAAAYTGYRKTASILYAILEHKDFKPMQQSKSKDWYLFKDLQSKSVEMTPKLRELEAQLRKAEQQQQQQQQTGHSAAGMTASSSSSKVSAHPNSGIAGGAAGIPATVDGIASITLNEVPTMERDVGQARAPTTGGSATAPTHQNGIKKPAPPPVPPASSKPAYPGNGSGSRQSSPTTPNSPLNGTGRVGASLRARMQALQNSGMQGIGKLDSIPTASDDGDSHSATGPPDGSVDAAPEQQNAQPALAPPFSLKGSPALRASTPLVSTVASPTQPSTANTGPLASSQQLHPTSRPEVVSPPHAQDPNTQVERPDSAPPTLAPSVANASGPAMSSHQMGGPSNSSYASPTGSSSFASSSAVPRWSPSLSSLRPTLSPRTSQGRISKPDEDLEERLAGLESPSDLESFANRFPDVDQEGFEILPSAPTFKPGDRSHFEKGAIPKPFHPAPDSSSTFDTITSRIDSLNSSANASARSASGARADGSLTPQTSGGGASSTAKPPAPSASSKPTRGPLPAPPSGPSLPNLSATTITPLELWSFLDSSSSAAKALPSILLLDVRNRKEHANGHIKGNTACIEPFLLSPNTSAVSIENTLASAPDEERNNFLRRALFDLIVVYDRSTIALPSKGGSSSPSLASSSAGFRNTPVGVSVGGRGPMNGATPSSDGSSQARTLSILMSAIYEFNFSDTKNRLKRSPLLLVGGYDAWLKEVGEKGIAKSSTYSTGYTPAGASSPKSPSSKESEYQNMLANRGILQPTPSTSAADIKRQHRKAVVSGDSLISSPPSTYTNGSMAGADSVGSPILAPTPAYVGGNYNGQFSHPPITIPPVAVHRTGPASPYEAYPATPIRVPVYGAEGQVRQNGEYFNHQFQPTQSFSSFGIIPQHAGNNSTSLGGGGAGGLPYQPTRPIDYPNLQQRHRVTNGSPARPSPPPLQSLHTPSGKVQIPPPVLARAPSSTALEGPGSITGSAAQPFQLLQSASYLSNPAAGSFPKQLTALGDGSIGLTGLKNLGNTCYMNSMIQCLSATIPLARFLKEGSYKKAVNKQNPLGTKGVLADAVASLVQSLWSEQYSFLAPVTFREAICRFQPRFKGSDQHDSQEFLSFMLDGLHEDLNLVINKPPPVEYTPEREAELESLPTQIAAEREWNIYLRRDDSIIVRLLQGQYKNQLKCLTCGATSTTYNTFMYLSLPVPSGKNIGKVLLAQCIDILTKPETLEGGDAWNCPKCKKPRSATKTLTISRLPPILLIHLKRFSFQGPFTDKIDTSVVFPVRNLDMTPWMPPPLDPAIEARYATAVGGKSLEHPSYFYNLHAVSNHFGSLSSGHYTAYVRNRGTWHDLNDSKVNKITEAQVAGAQKSCYTLWYTRSG